MPASATAPAKRTREPQIPDPMTIVRFYPNPVDIIRSYVESDFAKLLAGEHERLLGRQTRCCIRLEALHPAELIGKLLGAYRIAIGEVERDHPDRTALRREHALDPPRLLIALAAWQSSRNFSKLNSP